MLLIRNSKWVLRVLNLLRYSQCLWKRKNNTTNDWYQDASTKDLATGYTVMDSAIDNIKQIVSKCWDNNIYAIVGTLTPRNDITEDGKRLFDYFNDWVKDWTTEQSLLGKKCAYIDFFNAGKDLDPPCPLEDPDKPYHLNPLCDLVCINITNLVRCIRKLCNVCP